MKKKQTSQHIILNGTEIKRLNRLRKQYRDAANFVVATDSSSGIGQSTVVKIETFSGIVSVDITDYKVW